MVIASFVETLEKPCNNQRHCAANGKVEGSIPDEVNGFFK
jgi:hypothetical protein